MIRDAGSPMFPIVDAVGKDDDMEEEVAGDEDELVPVTDASLPRAVWAAIICWIHCCWAGLNSGTSLGIEVVALDVTELVDEDEASEDKLIITYNKQI